MNNYTVWVGGTEVNDRLVSKEMAECIAKAYEVMGYDDIKIDKYESEVSNG